MKQRFRLYRRKLGGRFYLHDGLTGKQESLGISVRTEAKRLLHAKNEAEKQPAINLQIARAYRSPVIWFGNSRWRQDGLWFSVRAERIFLHSTFYHKQVIWLS